MEEKKNELANSIINGGRTITRLVGNLLEDARQKMARLFFIKTILTSAI